MNAVCGFDKYLVFVVVDHLLGVVLGLLDQVLRFSVQHAVPEVFGLRLQTLIEPEQHLVEVHEPVSVRLQVHPHQSQRRLPII